ncbi:MAG: ABC transporter ATP-binding protein [Pseudomonadota bacterium]
MLLRDAELRLSHGATLAIAGPNGAGKSTLMALLAGILTPTEGTIEIGGLPLASLSGQDRARRIALVSQHANPDGRLTLRDYVGLGQLPIWAEHGPDVHRAALDHVLDLTQLLTKAAHPMARLSGGECQRAHIARALAQRPELLLLDEPTNHLDPDAKGRMLSLVASLGITVVMVVHDLVLIPEFASHTALVQDGRLTAFGPTKDVLTPKAVSTTFGVDYLLLAHGDRKVPALDIRRTDPSRKATIS